MWGEFLAMARLDQWHTTDPGRWYGGTQAPFVPEFVLFLRQSDAK
jgi:hypothetical protein